jgi:hypothetical protein
MIQDLFIRYPNSITSDAFLENLVKQSPISTSTVNNYMEQGNIYFPQSPNQEITQDPLMPEKKPSGFFIVIENTLFKVK